MKANLHKFVHPQVVSNGVSMTVDKYRHSIEEGIAAVPDLFVGAHTVIADNRAQRVAARLETTGTPVKDLARVEPKGGQSRFAEHVVYQFRDGKIARLWSIADWTTGRHSLSGSSTGMDILGIGVFVEPV